MITGDRVTVAGDRLLVRPGMGREHLQFRTFKRAGHLNVVPADALAMVRTGQVDARLFDVTAQVGYGYDQRADLPLLVTPTGRSLVKPAAPAGLKVDRNLPAVRGFAGRAQPADLPTVSVTAPMWPRSSPVRGRLQRHVQGGRAGGQAHRRHGVRDVRLPRLGHPRRDELGRRRPARQDREHEPHVAGAAAILLQPSPALTGPGLKSTLMASAVPSAATSVYGQGAGRVDVPRSLAAALTTSPASVSFGIQQLGGCSWYP